MKHMAHLVMMYRKVHQYHFQRCSTMLNGASSFGWEA